MNRIHIQNGNASMRQYLNSTELTPTVINSLWWDYASDDTSVTAVAGPSLPELGGDTGGDAGGDEPTANYIAEDLSLISVEEVSGNELTVKAGKTYSWSVTGVSTLSFTSLYR